MFPAYVSHMREGDAIDIASAQPPPPSSIQIISEKIDASPPPVIIYRTGKLWSLFMYQPVAQAVLSNENNRTDRKSS